MSTVKAVILDWAGTVVDFGSRAPPPPDRFFGKPRRASVSAKRRGGWR